MLSAAAFPYALSLPPGAVLEPDGEGGVRARAGVRAAGLGPLAPAVLDALSGLLGPPIRQEALIAGLHRAEPAGMLAMFEALARLAEAGLLRRSVPGPDGAPLATLAPLRAGFEAEHRPAGADATFRLARFARLVQGEGVLQLECPLAPARVELPDWRAAALVPALAAGSSLRRIAPGLPGLDPQAAGLVAGLMRSAGLLEDRDAAPAAPAAAGWEAADLEVHVHSRRGFRDGPIGATHPGGRDAPPPRAPFCGPAVDLPRPDEAALAAADPPFARVLDGRRSVRRFAAAPVALERIGELLHRAARARPPGPGGRGGARPYPNGGAGYEFETYVVAGRCAGLVPGLHRLDPEAFRLHLVRPRDARVARLLEDAARSAGAEAPPPVLIVLAARFGRVQWRYERLAYALILKNVGVALQTFALSAEAMGLAGCVLGGGDSALFAEVAGTDPFEEGSVGEIMIGEPSTGETP